MKFTNTQIDPGPVVEHFVYQVRTLTFRVTFLPLWDTSIQPGYSSSAMDQATRPKRCCKHDLCPVLAFCMHEHRIMIRRADQVERG
jgi:hypothetical protein